MNEQQKASGKRTGFMEKIRTYLHRHRIGELLVMTGRISADDLKYALEMQKRTGIPLGEILVNTEVLSRNNLKWALWQQQTVRAALAVMAVTVSTMSFHGKARAGSAKLNVGQSNIQMVSAAKAPDLDAPKFDPVRFYPALFGSTEKSSRNIRPFTKWNGVMSKIDRMMRPQNINSNGDLQNWKNAVLSLKNLDAEQQINRVNDMMNAVDYVTDNKNYGQSDYWATLSEFLNRGGDCEDFAIAKYVSLKALGFPEERLRIAIVHDNYKNIPHAILIVYANDNAYVLDNQMKKVMRASELSERYKPLYTINRNAWWLHKKPTRTILASAR